MNNIVKVFAWVFSLLVQTRTCIDAEAFPNPGIFPKKTSDVAGIYSCYFGTKNLRFQAFSKSCDFFYLIIFN